MVVDTVGLALPLRLPGALRSEGRWMPYLALSCPIVVGGAWLIRDPWPWMLVKILAAFVPVHGFLPEACGFLPGSLRLAWVGAATDVHIPLIESLPWSVMRRVSAPRYMLSGMLASSFVR
jgi:hypothetical protein